MSLRLDKRQATAGAILCCAAVVAVVALAGRAGGADKPAAQSAKPALTVTAVTPASADWPRTLTANGNVAAWQEAVVGAEIGGFRLLAVEVNVGDRVKRGQLLARVSSDTVEADLAQSRAAVAEAKATLAGARADAERARALQPSGALSVQQINQYSTAAETAQARLEAARARVRADKLRLTQTRVVAPDDGVISARNATVGAVVQNGQELFRLIRKGRLEWRGEVTAADFGDVRPGMSVKVLANGIAPVTGKVRMLAPTIDAQTRNGLVYVDLPDASEIRAGMFARGEFDLGRAKALTLPQSAVLLRDGFSYVFRIGADGRVVRVKVTTGRRVDDRVEVLSGLDSQARVVGTGTGFLADGDLVKVVDAPAARSAAALDDRR